MLNEYIVKIKDESDEEKVKNLAKRLSVNVQKKGQEEDYLKFHFKGHLSLLPGQLESLLNDMGAYKVAVDLATKKPQELDFGEEDRLAIKNTTYIDQGVEPQTDFDFDVERTNQYLSRMQSIIGDEMPGEEVDSQTQNFPPPGNGEETYEDYIQSTIESFVDIYDVTEDEALSALMGVADDMETEGKLPPVPDKVDGASDQDYSKWVGQAKSIGLRAMAIEKLD